MNWLKSTLATVAGTQEPEYGPGAIRSVALQVKDVPYTELAKEDLRWRACDYTNVETQTFYIMSDSGILASVQVIYSNIAGIHTTAQFNTKIFNRSGDGPHSWYSDPLTNFMFDESMLSFGADNMSLELNEEGTAYTIKSAVNDDSLVNLTFTRSAPGLVVGKDGTTYFGTDAKNPWGSMRHAFWPRCVVDGTIQTRGQVLDLKGRGLFIQAFQGMKPHHAAARWNFLNFQTPAYSAIMMEFTTPASYNTTVVNVGAIVKDGEIIYAGVTNSAAHSNPVQDQESGWPEPTSIKWTWDGNTKDLKQLHAEVDCPLGKRLDRVDVMAEVPGFIKTLAGSIAGTRPYIFQYSPHENAILRLKVDDIEIQEEGRMFAEATFIS